MAQRSGLGQEQVRRNNLSLLLSRVHVSGPTSRADLTRELGLNRSTIGDLAGYLEELGLVEPGTPVGDGRSGRPSLVVAPRNDNVVAAVDIDVDSIVVALIGLGGEVFERIERHHQPGDHDVVLVADVVSRMVQDVLDAQPTARCLGVGVSIPGAVRHSDGVVRFAPNLGWVDAPFGALLQARVGLPVVSGNDADLGALAEHLRGAAIGYDDVAYLAGSVGIGGGFLVGGRPFGGAHGYAGEIGHVPVDAHGPPCRCGNSGCWEMTIGENRLLTRAGRLPGGGLEAVAEVVAAAHDGEARARKALDEVLGWMGVGLRAIINIFDPQVIVLGGWLAMVADEVDAVAHATQDRTRAISPREDVLIRAAALGRDSSLLGAAELAFAPLLADPMAAQDRLAVSAPASRTSGTAR